MSKRGRKVKSYRIVDGIMYVLCRKCGEYKTCEMFQKDRSRASGCRELCKPCIGIVPKPIIPANHLICSACHQLKSCDRYYRNAAQKSGYKNQCKECFRQLQKTKWKDDEALRLRTMEQHRQWRLRHYGPPKERVKVSPEEKAQRYQEYLKKHREQYWNDPEYREKKLAESRAYHQKNRAPMIARKHRREAMQLQQDDGTVSAKALERLFKQARQCAYCTAKINSATAEVDHMDPVSRGGLHGLSNIVLVCHKCNSYKRARPFSEWLTLVPQERKQFIINLYARKHGRAPDQSYLPLIFNFSPGPPDPHPQMRVGEAAIPG